jgi:uncharacterized protein (UPF0276 family)
MAETVMLDRLLELRRDYEVSLHGVALSLGSAEQLDRSHLGRFKTLIGRVEPVLVSEHLAWSAIGGAYLNDLLPFPYTEESLDLFRRHVEETQEALGRRLLIENPSSYLRYHHSSIPEAEFLTEVARRAGCGILCDVNNIYVSARNFGFNPIAYLDALPIGAIGEIHLAGPSRRRRRRYPDRRPRLQGCRARLGPPRRGAAALRSRAHIDRVGHQPSRARNLAG